MTDAYLDHTDGTAFLRPLVLLVWARAERGATEPMEYVWSIGADPRGNWSTVVTVHGCMDDFGNFIATRLS